MQALALQELALVETARLMPQLSLAQQLLALVLAVE